MNQPFFTIITATFNSEKTLQRTIESVLNQTVTNFEYLIIDGNSKDNTVSIIKEYQSIFEEKNLVLKYISEPDKGIYDAWNKGLNRSNGEWISFLGSDDYYVSDALEIYKSIPMQQYNYIHSKVKLVNEKGEELRILGNDLKENLFMKYMNIAHVGSFHHKSLFTSERFNLKYKSSSDYFFFLKNYDLLKPFFIDKITACMQHGGISTQVNSALKETLLVKLELQRRNRFLCYIDFIIAHLKHFLRRYIR